MWNREKKEPVPEISDPQLEFARLAFRLSEQQTARDKLSGDPPLVIDSDFCFGEETKK